jgi:hypothetical protein
MRRSRKPVWAVSSIEGSNPSLSASTCAKCLLSGVFPGARRATNGLGKTGTAGCRASRDTVGWTRRLVTAASSDSRRRFVPQRTGRVSDMYLGSTGLASGIRLPSASTGLGEPSGVTAASSIRANPVLSGGCPAPSTRSDHPPMLSYQRRAPAPYGSAYQPLGCPGDSASWTLLLRKVKAMVLSFRGA